MPTFSDLQTRMEALRTATQTESVTNSQLGQILKDFLQLVSDISKAATPASDVSFTPGSGSLASGNNVQTAIESLSSALVSRLNAVTTHNDNDIADVESRLTAEINKKENATHATSQHSLLADRIDSLISEITVSVSGNQYKLNVVLDGGETYAISLPNDSRYSPYSGTSSGLRSTNVQAAIDEFVLSMKSQIASKLSTSELNSRVANLTSYLKAAIDGIEVYRNDGKTYLRYTTIAGDEDVFEIVPHASGVIFNNNGTGISATNVQTAIVTLITRLASADQQIASLLASVATKANASDVSDAFSDIREQLALKAVASDVQAEVIKLQNAIALKQDAATLQSVLTDLNNALTNVISATASANSATASANSATANANSAASDARTVTGAMTTLLDELDLPTVKSDAEAATEAANAAAESANTAAESANTAAESIAQYTEQIDENKDDIADLALKITELVTDTEDCKDVVEGRYWNGSNISAIGDIYTGTTDGNSSWISNKRITLYEGDKITATKLNGGTKGYTYIITKSETNEVIALGEHGANDKTLEYTATQNCHVYLNSQVDSYTVSVIRNRFSQINHKVNELDNNKVDKVEGKGLSTNDFTDNYKDAIDDVYDGTTSTKTRQIDGKTANGYRITSGSLETSTKSTAVATFAITKGNTYVLHIPKTGNSASRPYAFTTIKFDETTTSANMYNAGSAVDPTENYEYEFTNNTDYPYIACTYNYADGLPTITETSTINGLLQDEKNIKSNTDRIETLEEQISAEIVVDKYESICGKDGLQITASAFTDGQVIECTDFPQSNQFGNRYSFFAEFTTFGTLVIGQGYQSYRGLSFYIDNTNIVLKNDTAENVVETIPHDLTLSTFIQVLITHLDNGKFYVVINTLNGVFTITTTFGKYLASSGSLKLVNSGSYFTDLKFSATNKNFRMPLWIFGASYEGLSSTRWAGQMKSLGFFEFFINSYAGRSSEPCWKDFQRCLNFGCPKYLYWCMYGNGSYSDLDTYIGKVKDICDEKGITLILIKRPNAPTMTNYTERKQIIEKYVAKGARYVNAGIALSSNPDDANSWYSGYLGSDQKHPSTIGARALAMRVLVDIPEIMQYGYTTNNGLSIEESNSDN